MVGEVHHAFEAFVVARFELGWNYPEERGEKRFEEAAVDMSFAYCDG